MGIRNRIKRLEGRGDFERMTLVCPECGEEFPVSGDAPLEYIVYRWSKATGERGHRETPRGMLRAFEHEHDPGAFVEKSSGLWFLGKPVSGMNLGGRMHGLAG
jgi:hypothetical protein